MPQIVMAPSKGGDVDTSVKKQAFAFLEKLSTDDSLAGLHIEPIAGCIDERVRTGRVNDFWRAVLFKLQGHGKDAHYIYIGVWPHDEAIAIARKSRLSVNPVNGIAELITATDGAVPAAAPARPIQAPKAEAPPSLLGSRGFDLQSLVEDLGIDPDLARAALAATSEDEMLVLAETAVQWQGLALIDLASGTPLWTVKATLGLDTPVEPHPEPATPEQEDDALIAALQHPAARLQFALIEDNEELRRALEDGDFAAWRVFLHPEQRKYASQSYNGPFRLSGGAGTGKTVVLVHRARHLARQNPAARILLTTYTRTLAEAMDHALQRLDPTLPRASKLGDSGVYVTGIDAAARAVLVGAKDLAMDLESVLGVRSPVISGRTAQNAWAQAAATVPELPDELSSAAFLSAEYAMVVLPGRITTRDEYLTARRPGRGVALDRKKRIAVWAAIEAYRSGASIEGSIDFAEVPAVAAAHLDRTAGQSGTPRVDHVLVDEGQDLTPAHWQFLRALVAPGPNDLFIAEDAHQRIYGQSVVLGRYGIQIVGRSQRLRLNYRTTAENLRYAVGALSGAAFVDLEGEPEVADYRSARSGPAPRIIPCPSLTAELDKAAEEVSRWLAAGVEPEAIGLLVRDSHQATQLARGLDDRGVAVRVVEQGAPRPGRPLVMTMHRAKGMEFSRVLIAGANADLLPAEYLLKGLTDADRMDVLARERSLLYVAMTRARDELLITTSGSPSNLLPTTAVS
ncbi:3'-5' exonuclease [Sporichthya brevicatena]|uniref:DNA 3'-5' helicase n=1 Tax=Sporichthya brevicatena TaxID=171442 RepID=A0ABN1H4R8_9ACTN